MLEFQTMVALAGGILGLLLGSFLNVVVHRLPKMMEQSWAQEYADMQGQEPPAVQPLNLLVPRSRCPHCEHQIRWFENVPVVSYVCLRGRCSACQAQISPRYPLVELATGCLFFFCFWHWGPSFTGLAWSGFAAALLTLALIDWDTTLLPDSITLPLVWAGLIASSLHWTSVPMFASLWGAVAGYLSLWSIYWIFKLLTGKEGMGYGDFKLFAALGAWFGWEALVPMVLMASVIGAVIGIAMKFSTGLREGGYIPFGPFLAGAGLTAMVFGPEAILHFVGL
ncbi:MAG: A24 family peptidase [Burkholderiales bacterium]|nr:A24 family peptidase [Burkholderiales bacterium]